jgi:hypothetical protein
MPSLLALIAVMQMALAVALAASALLMWAAAERAAARRCDPHDAPFGDVPVARFDVGGGR